MNIECEIVYVFLGGIDASTHFFRSWNNTSPVDDFYSGTKAALAGGTTMISEFQSMFSLWLAESLKKNCFKAGFGIFRKTENTHVYMFCVLCTAEYHCLTLSMAVCFYWLFCSY